MEFTPRSLELKLHGETRVKRRLVRIRERSRRVVQRSVRRTIRVRTNGLEVQRVVLVDVYNAARIRNVEQIGPHMHREALGKLLRVINLQVNRSRRRRAAVAAAAIER